MVPDRNIQNALEQEQTMETWAFWVLASQGARPDKLQMALYPWRLYFTTMHITKIEDAARNQKMTM